MEQFVNDTDICISCTHASIGNIFVRIRNKSIIYKNKRKKQIQNCIQSSLIQSLKKNVVNTLSATSVIGD